MAHYVKTKPLSTKEVDRRDAVDTAVQDMLLDVIPTVCKGKKIRFSVEQIAKVREVVQSVFVDDLMCMTTQDFYPLAQPLFFDSEDQN